MSTYKVHAPKHRPRQFLMLFTYDEHEWLIRHCFKHRTKIGPYVRRRAVPYGWRLELEALREEQKGIELNQMTHQYGRSGRYRGKNSKPQTSPEA